jgi:cytidylate kinase
MAEDRLRRANERDGRESQAAKKKCKERELLKLAYWKINRPK